MSGLPGKLGQELYDAAKFGDLERLLQLTFSAVRTHWTDLPCAAASTGATAVAAHCLTQGAVVEDHVLDRVLACPRLDAVYHLLIERGAVDVRYYTERTGTVLGRLASGQRHELARFALQDGANPDLNVSALLGRPPLAYVARRSDTQMIDLLLEHGATLNGSCALYSAAEQGKIENARLSRGADPNAIAPMRAMIKSREKAGKGMYREFDRNVECRL